MKRAIWMMAALVLLLGGGGPATAGYILVVGDSSATMQTQLASLGDTSTVVSESSFSTASFSGYSGIWIGTVSTGINLASRMTDLTNFMNSGGNVLFESIAPYESTTSANDLPFGNQFTVVNQTQGGFGDTVHITNASSPVNANLTDAGMSNWGYSHHNYFTSIGSFVGLQDTGTAGDWVTIGLNVGQGHLIVTGLDNDIHNRPQGITFTGNALDLAPGINISGSTLSAVPAPSSLALCGTALFTVLGYFGYRRRKLAVA